MITADPIAAQRYRLAQIRIEKGVSEPLFEEPGVVAAGSDKGNGNSGFHACNLVAQWGVAKIALVGFDMRGDRGIHWHGKHGGILDNPRESNFAKWRPAFEKSAAIFRGRGITVINCSPVSTITAFPIMSLEEALAC